MGLEEEVRLEVLRRFEGTFYPALWKERKMDGKGGERKAVLRGHSWPSQPALEHPGGSESGAFVVAPGGDAHGHGPPR